MSITPTRLAEIRRMADNASDIGMSQVVRELLDEVERLTPRWQEGPPPDSAEFVFREEESVAVPVQISGHSKGPAVWFYRPGILSDEPWGTARWAPIPNPTEG